MAFKIVLMLGVMAQIAAAVLALRLNFRYRIYSAWVLISAAAFAMAILRVTRLIEIWHLEPTIHDDSLLWTNTISWLMVSVFLLAGLALVDPFFQALEKTHETTRLERERLQSDLMETESELRLARQIQRDLLPKSPPDLPGLEIAALCEPAEWTSGDFFDYVTLENGEVAFIVADACGHGLGPALLTSSARASIRGVAKTVHDVGPLLTLANTAVYDPDSSRFVTAFAATIGTQDRVLAYAGAGQPAFLLRADGARQTLMPEAPPLGVNAEISLPTQRELTLESGDILILVTDGILETADSNFTMFGQERLFDSVEKHRTQCPATIVKRLFDAAHEFAGRRPQADDTTAVLIKVK